MAVVLQASGEAIGTVVDLYDGTGARGAHPPYALYAPYACICPVCTQGPAVRGPAAARCPRPAMRCAADRTRGGWRCGLQRRPCSAATERK
jgi:hypothetical protein